MVGRAMLGRQRSRLRWCVLLLALALCAAAAAGAHDAAACARAYPWLQQYGDFQAQQRANPNASFIVHQWGAGGGLGDRLHGFLWTVRLAAALKRVVLFDWPGVARVEDLLLPSQLDWRLNGSTAVTLAQVNATRAFIWSSHKLHTRSGLSREDLWQESAPGMHGRRTRRLPLPSVLRAWQRQRLVVLRTNQRFGERLPGDLQRAAPMQPAAAAKASNGTGAPAPTPSAGTCLARFVLKFSPQVEAAADEIVRAAIGAEPGQPFHALHLRLGGLAGEKATIMRSRRIDRLDLLLSVLACARAHAEAHPLRAGPRNAAARMMLVADHAHARALAQQGVFSGFGSPPDAAKHWKVSGGLDLAAQTQIVAEVAALSRATCLVRTVSGFSELAVLFGGQNCTRVVTTPTSCDDVVRAAAATRKHA